VRQPADQIVADVRIDNETPYEEQRQTREVSAVEAIEEPPVVEGANDRAQRFFPADSHEPVIPAPIDEFRVEPLEEPLTHVREEVVWKDDAMQGRRPRYVLHCHPAYGIWWWFAIGEPAVIHHSRFIPQV
jgi:hypothetical protein